MGTLGGGNGGERPPEGGGQRDGLPGLPPEWGTVIIPDDASELDAEAVELRRELRREARQSRWRRRFGLSGRTDPDEPSIGLPLLIMAIAVVATLTSLFAVAWPRPQRGDQPPAPARSAAVSVVPDLTLTAVNGAPVRLRQTVPSVILLVEGCECAALVRDTSAAAPDLRVLPVSRTRPGASAGTGSTDRATGAPAVQSLLDPTGSLRSALGLPAPDGSAAVLLVAAKGEIARLLPTTRSVEDFRADLDRLRR